MKTCPPVVLLIFNRPEFVRRVVDAIRSVRPRQVFVVADGPRGGVHSDKIACSHARAEVKHGINWPCEVRWELTEQNLGCGRRVASGLDWVFSQVEEAIVLEDDCVAAEKFFPFCAELLDRYRDDARVGAIGGANFQPRDVSNGVGFYFSRYPHVWGWATWRRAWRGYDHAMVDWPAAKREGWPRDYFGTAREAEFWTRVLDRVWEGEIDSWAYRWAFAVWRRDWLAALPATSLVTNIGFGDASTHTKRVPAGLGTNAQEQPWPLGIVPDIARNEAADRRTFEHHFHPTLSARIQRKVGQLFGRR